MRRSGYFVVMLAFVPSFILAQSNIHLEYKGRLTDRHEIPITTPTPAQFTICQDADPSSTESCGGGAAVYSEETVIAPDKDGLFNYQIGTGTHAPPDLDLGVFNTTQAVYLEVTINGQMLLPRNLLVLNQDASSSRSYLLESNASANALALVSTVDITTGRQYNIGGNRVLGISGSRNLFLGVGAGRSNSTGQENTASGTNALFSNTAGSYNTSSGADALYSNTTGRDNTANGDRALLSNTTGSYNTAMGSSALQVNTVGSANTAIGTNALFFNTTGSYNTASGLAALIYNTAGEGNTANGYVALGSNSTGSRNTASGNYALQSSITGSDNTAVGNLALYRNRFGNGNTAIGSHADTSYSDLTNATAIGYQAVVNASNKIRLGNASVTVIEGEVGFTSSSDAFKKENFRPVNGEAILEKIRQLTLTSWNFIGQSPEVFRHYGPTAQQFFAAFGNDGVGTIGTPRTITSTDIEGILMIAVQALERRTIEQKLRVDEGKQALDTLREENAILRTEVGKLRTRLEALEGRSDRTE